MKRSSSKSQMIEAMDGFDRLPDSLILLIFNSISDIKALIRCRSVSKRFNSLVPQTESLSLKVDCVISPESESDSLFTLFKSLLKSIHDLFKPDPKPTARNQTQNSPARILSQFDRIRDLQIELPAGDLKLEKGAVIKWRAEFGKSLRSCVILGFRRVANPEGNSADEEIDFTGGLKTRVVWAISALIAASARHYLLNDVVKEHREMERLVLVDREGEGTVAMEKEGLRECREEARGGEWEEDGGRTVVPCVRMRMRHEQRVQLKDGVWMEGVTLVVVRPCSGGGDVEDAELALGAFGGGIYGEAVQDGCPFPRP
ncbi:F-box protein AUF2-like isoform X2 [Populus nigra]|uniref:F-box protein AUF2-like isoform X2 n=1 Tax=Populus nigra TaxID=3691 RepID=UPI002B26FADB|nr:F-box protein AUF2-like isoform X2 [Populus nigra]